MSFQQSFIAQGTRLVIQKGDNKPMWYVTKKEIAIEGEPGVASCPLTRAEVRFVNQDGFRVYYPANIARTREVMEDGDLNGDTIKNMRPCLFVYDIPDRSEFPNPSSQLRSIGVRINLSGWLINESDTPHALIGKMLDAGCNPHIFRFDAAEGQRLVSVAVATLKKEIEDATKRAQKSLQDAEAKLVDPNDTRSTDAKHEWFLARAEAIRERLNELKEDLATVSKRFGIGQNVLRVERLHATGEAIQSGMAARAHAYLDGARKLIAGGTADGKAMGKAMLNDKVPFAPAADLLRETVGDEAADAMQTAFDESGDGTYSLVGAGSDAV